MKNFYHGGALGDIIYSLPVIIASGGGNLYIRHIDKVSRKYNDYLGRLLSSQPYIYNVISGDPYPDLKDTCDMGIEIECDGKTYYNFDLYREMEIEKRERGIYCSLAQAHLDIFGLDFDLSQPWLFNIPPLNVADIVINRTRRYHDKEEIDWSLLEEYMDRTIWIGKRKEYWLFVDTYGLEFKPYECDDLFDVARIIKGSKLFIGNQSVCFAIAEALKVPRVLEIFYKKDNCRPNSDNGYTFLTKELLEEYVE